ncbi:TPA: response regulator [Candidatus Shapirobacteria bacterium]|nr:response regulator [Candidatus Shapirobacteria bacterium]
MVTKQRILVVDDDSGVLEAIKIILVDSGFKVKTIISTDEFEKVMTRFKPDLVMLDIWMPKISGEVLCRKIKEDDNLKKIPVVLLSASNRTEKISKKCKADDYLTKPFDMEELIETVKRNLLPLPILKT